MNKELNDVKEMLKMALDWMEDNNNDQPSTIGGLNAILEMVDWKMKNLEKNS